MCEFLNLNIHQGVITAKSFQHTINNWSGMVNLHVSKKCFFGGNIQISEYKTTLNVESFNTTEILPTHLVKEFSVDIIILLIQVYLLDNRR